MALSAGTRLGAYEIVGRLGAGGMGEVYRTRDTRLHRDVALKILPDTFTQDPERLARFRREAQVLAALNHPHIAAIYGFEEAGGAQFLVLELVDGETLDTRVAQGPIAVDEALGIARQIAEAMEAAHEKGIVHRDLKPANIALTRDGNVKVLDFGLAKATDVAGVTSELANSPTIAPSFGTAHGQTAMTQAGMILGTAAYMSPEQAKGLAADKRSDVWAFGCVLYEMLTARRAFGGEDVSDLLAAVLRGEPDWTALPPEVSPGIRVLLMRCLEKDRKKRIADISTAVFLIDEPAVIAPAAGVSVPVTERRAPAWKRAAPFLVTALVAGGLVAGVAWTLRPRAAAPTVTRFTVPLAEGQRFTNDGRHVVAISPDGAHIVYVANAELHLRSMSADQATPLPGTQVPEGVLNPVFSPDGRSLAFWVAADGTIRKIAINGAAAVTICPAGRPLGMSWDAGGILFGQGNQGIMRVAATGGQPERVVSVGDGEIAHGPQMLPDGRTVLFTVATGTGADRWDKAKVVVQALGSSERKTVIDGGSDGRYLATGHIVYALGGIVFAVPFDTTRLEVTGEPVPIVEGVRRGTTPEVNPGVAQFSVSATGSLVYVPGPVSTVPESRALARLPLTGDLEPLKLPRGRYEFLRVSPDGKWLTFGTDDGKEAIVWIYELSGASSMRRLTVGGRNRFPIWSSDGVRVAFQSDREGDFGIFWQRADGTGPAERLTQAEDETTHFPEAWTPDGERLLFSKSDATGASLWTLSLRDRKTEPFGGVRSSGPILPRAVVSPDGQWVAYTSNETGTTKVYAQPFPPTGAKYPISTGNGHSPLWSRNGKRLFYADFGQLVVMNVTTQPTFSFGNPVPVPTGTLQILSGLGLNAPRRFDMAPDGAMIGIVDTNQASSELLATPEIEVVLNWFEELKARVPTHAQE